MSSLLARVLHYTATPGFSLSGGGAATPATITGAAPTANTGGNLAFTGTATTTLNGASTYTGNTYILGGTLALGTGGIYHCVRFVVDVTNGASYSVPAGYSIPAGQTLRGSGSVTLASVLTNSAGTLGGVRRGRHWHPHAQQWRVLRRGRDGLHAHQQDRRRRQDQRSGHRHHDGHLQRHASDYQQRRGALTVE